MSLIGCPSPQFLLPAGPRKPGRKAILAVTQTRGALHMQGPSQTKSIPRLFYFVVILSPCQGRQGRRRRSKHKLIVDGSACNHVRLLLPCNRAGLHFWPPLVLCATTLNEAMICHTSVQPVLFPGPTLTSSIAFRLLFSMGKHSRISEWSCFR